MLQKKQMGKLDNNHKIGAIIMDNIRTDQMHPLPESDNIAPDYKIIYKYY